MSSSNNDDAIDLFKILVETQGVAVSTVSDGHVLMFKRSFLESILKKNDQEKVIIFIKRPDFKN